MPAFQLLLEGNQTSFDVVLPAQVNNVTHFHWKAGVVRFNQAVAGDVYGMEIQIPCLKHFYQINSSTSRTSVIIPLSTDSKTTYFYPDIVFVGEPLSNTMKINLLRPSTGQAFSDTGGAQIQYVFLLFEYSEE